MHHMGTNLERNVPMGTQSVVTVGLFVRLVAKEGKERAVEEFLRSGLALVQAEPGTLQWYAVRFDQRTFAIFDTFASEEGRQAHLSGRVAAALMANASELLAEPPRIERHDVLAAKT
jgi:quinol monooxygenase YgiN